MTSLRRTTYPAVQSGDRSWLAGPHGTEPNAMPGVTVDTALFPAGAKTNGYVKSGTVITETATKGIYGPYDAAAPAGRRHGILFQDIDTSHGDGKFGTGLLVHGFVFGAKLPGGEPADTVKAKLPLIFFLDK